MEIIQKAITNYLRNFTAENDHDMVADLVQSYKGRWCNTSLKVHFLEQTSSQKILGQ
jgi:hypothetical protein